MPAPDRSGHLHAPDALRPAKEPLVLPNRTPSSLRSQCGTLWPSHYTYWAFPPSELRLHTQNSGHNFWSTCSSMWGVSASSVCESHDRPSLGITLWLACSTPEVEITLHLLIERQSWTADFVGSQNNITRLCMSLHDNEQVRRWWHSVKEVYTFRSRHNSP